MINQAFPAVAANTYWVPATLPADRGQRVLPMAGGSGPLTSPSPAGAPLCGRRSSQRSGPSGIRSATASGEFVRASARRPSPAAPLSPARGPAWRGAQRPDPVARACGGAGAAPAMSSGTGGAGTAAPEDRGRRASTCGPTER